MDNSTVVKWLTTLSPETADLSVNFLCHRHGMVSPMYYVGLSVLVRRTTRPKESKV